MLKCVNVGMCIYQLKTVILAFLLSQSWFLMEWSFPGCWSTKCGVKDQLKQGEGWTNEGTGLKLNCM